MTPSTPQQPRISKQTRILVQAAAAACEEKKGLDTRILELDPVDSGLSDFFLITSASNNRQTVAIADEIEISLKRNFGVYPRSVEGRRLGEWILMDYVDFVVHVFLAERRAYYDIERLRKSARPLTPAEFDAELATPLKKRKGTPRTKVAAKPAHRAAAQARVVSRARPGDAKRSASKKSIPQSKPAAKKSAGIRQASKKPTAKRGGAVRPAAKPATTNGKGTAKKK